MMSMLMHKEITELIGRTPLVRLNRLSQPGGATIYGKVEFFNPGGSVKDRICLNMINEAERLGKLKPGGTIVEPTSGNTGIGLALISAVRGYKLILVMPESMSMERASLLSSYGAQLVLTPAWEGMKGSIREAESHHCRKIRPILCRISSRIRPTLLCTRRRRRQRFGRPSTERSMRLLPRSVPAAPLPAAANSSRNAIPSVKVIAVEPAGSPVLSGGEPGPHKIQGIGAGFIPKVLNRKILDRVIKVTDDEAYQTAKQLSKKEGLLVGISAGANVFAAQQVAEELGPGKNVVTILCDTGERYISIEKYFNI